MELQYIAQELLSRSMLLIYRALFHSLAACHLRKNWPKGRHDWTLLLKDWAPKFDSGVAQSRSKHPLQSLTITGKPCGHGEEWIANSPAPLPSFAWFSAVLPESTGESRSGSWWAVLPACLSHWCTNSPLWLSQPERPCGRAPGSTKHSISREAQEWRRCGFGLTSFT